MLTQLNLVNEIFAMSRSIIFWGASGHAKVLNEVAAYSGFQLIAIFDNKQVKSSPVDGCDVFVGRAAFKEWREKFVTGEAFFSIAIGGGRGVERDDIFLMLKNSGLSPATLRHSTAHISNSASIEPGCQILAQSSVCVEARLGRNCIVNTGASVDHESRLGNSVHVCPGAKIAGEVKIGDGVLVGAGAVILPRLTVGKNSVVGAGSVVTRDVPDDVTVVGNPARILR